MQENIVTFLVFQITRSGLSRRCHCNCDDKRIQGVACKESQTVCAAPAPLLRKLFAPAMPLSLFGMLNGKAAKKRRDSEFFATARLRGKTIPMPYTDQRKYGRDLMFDTYLNVLWKAGIAPSADPLDIGVPKPVNKNL